MPHSFDKNSCVLCGKRRTFLNSKLPIDTDDVTRWMRCQCISIMHCQPCAEENEKKKYIESLFPDRSIIIDVEEALFYYFEVRYI